MTPELLVDAHAELGEGPSWDARQRLLFWTDIHAGRLHTYNPEERADTVVELGGPLGCLAPVRAGGLVLALRSGFSRFDPSTKVLTPLAQPEAHLPLNRFNDGKCDPKGRFLAGTMDDTEKDASGSLYSLAPDGTCKKLLTDLRISNGLTWSPDFKTFYFIDTPTRQIVAFDYELSTGNISNPRTTVYISEEMGWPDGMTADAEGMLWVAMWGGAAITRWNPSTGQLLEKVSLPALNVTSCVFGGPDLNELYITSARKGMTEEQLSTYPLSGGLFRVRTSCRGLPTFEFGE